jgi:hypothetical protein
METSTPAGTAFIAEWRQVRAANDRVDDGLPRGLTEKKVGHTISGVPV